MTGEHTFPGGIYYEGIVGDSGTAISLQGVGKGIEGNPFTVDLNITTGNGTYGLCGTTPDDMIRLAKWLLATARDIKKELEAQ